MRGEKVFQDEDKCQRMSSMIRWRQSSIDFDGYNEWAQCFSNDTLPLMELIKNTSPLGEREWKMFSDICRQAMGIRRALETNERLNKDDRSQKVLVMKSDIKLSSFTVFWVERFATKTYCKCPLPAGNLFSNRKKRATSIFVKDIMIKKLLLLFSLVIQFYLHVLLSSFKNLSHPLPLLFHQ